MQGDLPGGNALLSSSLELLVVFFAQSMSATADNEAPIVRAVRKEVHEAGLAPSASIRGTIEKQFQDIETYPCSTLKSGFSGFWSW